MNYDFTMLKTPADCDAVLAVLAREKTQLEFRRTTLEFRNDSAEASALEIQQELDGINAELTYLENFIATLPEGEMKEESEDKWRRADFRKYVLTRSKNRKGGATVFTKDYDIGIIEQSIEETDTVISGVTSRKNEL